MQRKGLVFRRSPIWTQSIGIACFILGAWVLWRNVELTIIGLGNMGINPVYAQPLGWTMASIEAAVSIFLTSPENWDDIWGLLNAPLNHNGLPKVPKYILASLILGLFLLTLIGVYWFDYNTTWLGLFPNSQSPTENQVLIVLAFNLGTELASFFGFQSMRMSKIASIEVLEESLTVEPKKAYIQRLLQHRIDTAKRQADAQIAQEEQAQAEYFSRNGRNPR
ncbi:hypothetical protein U2F10_05535 [Leptothoe sp. EHU-05/26/07-4]